MTQHYVRNLEILNSREIRDIGGICAQQHLLIIGITVTICVRASGITYELGSKFRTVED